MEGCALDIGLCGATEAGRLQTGARSRKRNGPAAGYRSVTFDVRADLELEPRNPRHARIQAAIFIQA